MSIGYACMLVGVPGTELSGCTMKTSTDDKLRIVTQHNINALDNIMDYNKKNNIRLFRISSDIIPFGSHPVNRLPWWEENRDQLAVLGKKIKDYEIKVSMHPGQYTVLNSPDSEVVQRAAQDLIYHDLFLTSLGMDQSSKLVLHIGGVYGEKKLAAERFIANFSLLPDSVKSRLILENDDKNYTIEEVLDIAYKTGSPVVFDNLHHSIKSSETCLSDRDWILECKKTWKREDGRQKIHYSQQGKGCPVGGHSQTIFSDLFQEYYSIVPKDTDIMLEVKDKNLSAVKCNNLMSSNVYGKDLEKEWANYKYYVLSRSANHYQAIRQLLKKKEENVANEFYRIIEEAMLLEESIGAQINAAEHVWGYISEDSTQAEKNRYRKLLEGYKVKENGISPLKKHLLNCARKRNLQYLIYSYYFYL